MTKTISLSDDAYQALAACKGAEESFSDVALRLSGLARRRAVKELAGLWPLSKKAADALLREIYQDRDESARGRPRTS